MKDKQFIKYVESSVSRQDMLAFVCEDSSDQDKLLQTLREGQNLRINVVGMPRESMTAFTSPGPIGNYRYVQVQVCALFNWKKMYEKFPLLI